MYRTLAAETDLDIHVSGAEDRAPPSISGITYHTDGTAALDPYWVLAYDGGPERTQACGLVAERRSDESAGFWTNDPATVEAIETAFYAV